MADFTSGKNWSDFYSGILPPSAAPQPDAVDWNQFYSGILPATPSAPPVSPNLTAAEKQLLQQQLQQSQTLQAGYNPNGTAKIRPSWTIPTVAPVMTPNATPATWNRIDQAAYDAGNKRGTWLDQSRMQAQALMRQMAALQGGMPMAPGTGAPAAVPAGGGGLAALITGTGTPRAQTGGLVSLLGGGATAPVKTGPTGVGTNGYTYVNGQNMGYSADEQSKREARGKDIGERNRKSPGTTRNVFGDNNAFQPRSVQNSVRFQTGY